MIIENTPVLNTLRLTLRPFVMGDLNDAYPLYSDVEVNKFLPWYPHQSRSETEQYLRDSVLTEYDKTVAYCYAIELKENNSVIGFVVLHHIDIENGSGEFGYALRREYWNNGYITEACNAVLARLKTSGFHHIVATHDVLNPSSGVVMQKIGMKYCYTYAERIQPKDIEVKFRMYQLNFDNSDGVDMTFWDNSVEHYIETDIK